MHVLMLTFALRLNPLSSGHYLNPSPPMHAAPSGWTRRRWGNRLNHTQPAAALRLILGG